MVVYKIYKYQLAPDGKQAINLPLGCRVLDLQIQNGILCFWAIVQTYPIPDERTWIFHTIGTGHPVPSRLVNNGYVGTVQDGDFVWHVFREMQQ